MFSFYISLGIALCLAGALTWLYVKVETKAETGDNY